jgi:hypothetical protein
MKQIPRLLQPKKVYHQTYTEINQAQMMKLVRAQKLKKYGFLQVAYEVDEVQPGKFDVHMEYITA